MNNNDQYINSVDAFLSALATDINASPPDDLDADTVAFLRELVRAETVAPDKSIQQRVWENALADARGKSELNPTLNGHNPNQSSHDEDKQMSILQLTGTPKLQLLETTKRRQLPLTLAVAGLITLFIAGLLFAFNDEPDTSVMLSTPLQVTETAIPPIEEDVDIVALFERYVNEVIVAGDVDALEEILSLDHALVTGMQPITDLADTVDFFDDLSQVVTDATIDDYTADEESVWARLTITQVFDPIESVPSIANQDGTYSFSAVMVVYLDTDLGLFAETYLSALSDIYAFAPRNILDDEPAWSDTNDEIEQYNMRIVTTVLDVFWGAGLVPIRSGISAEELFALYAPDYRLYISENGGQVLQATDEFTPAELLAPLTLAIPTPNLALSDISITASGNYVFVDFAAEYERDGEIEAFTGNFAYHIIDGLITEEWWSSDMFVFTDADTGITNPFAEIYAQNTDIVQAVLTTYWGVEDFGSEAMDDEELYALYAPDYYLAVYPTDQYLWFPVSENTSVQDVLTSARIDFDLDDLTITDVSITPSGRSMLVSALVEREIGGVIESYQIVITYRIDDGMIIREAWHSVDGYFDPFFPTTSNTQQEEGQEGIATVRWLLENVWNADLSQIEPDNDVVIFSASMPTALYADDFRLNINQPSGNTVLATDDMTSVDELLNRVWNTVGNSLPDLNLQITDIRASVSEPVLVTVDFIATATVDDQQITSEGTFRFQTEDGFITEEWWTSVEDLFVMMNIPSDLQPPENIQIVQSVLDYYWNTDLSAVNTSAIDINTLYAQDYSLTVYRGGNVYDVTLVEGDGSTPIDTLLSPVYEQIYTILPDLELFDVIVTENETGTVQVSFSGWTSGGPVERDDPTYEYLYQNMPGTIIFTIVDGVIVEEVWQGSAGNIFLSIVQTGNTFIGNNILTIRENLASIRWILDNVWNVDLSNFSQEQFGDVGFAVNPDDVSALYASDFRLNIIQSFENALYETDETTTVGELLSDTRSALLDAYSELDIEIIGINSSGINFIVVDFRATSRIGTETVISEGDLRFEFEDGLITEEWWTSESDLFSTLITYTE